MDMILKKVLGIVLAVLVLVSAAAGFSGCTDSRSASQPAAETAEENQNGTAYSYSEVSLSRGGIDLHLDRVAVKDAVPEKNILLTHGVTYSSHEFDVDYKDYSLVRFLAREGYAVWRLDIAGFGQSGEVKDGFMPDSDYAAEDINAAVETIVSESGQEKIDLLRLSFSFQL